MNEKFNFDIDKHRDDIVGHAVLEMIGSLSEKEKDIIFNKQNEKEKPKVVVTTQINGISADFEVFVNTVWKQMERLILNKAKELIKEKFEKLDDDVYSYTEMINKFKNGLVKKFYKEYGVDCKEEEW